MSEPYQLFVFVKDGLPADLLIATVDQLVRNAGGVIDEDCLLILHDADDAEPIEDAAAALARLRDWPGLGSICYSMPESVITVTFRQREGEPRVCFSSLSILESALKSDEARARYRELAQALFDRLGATRVILDWGLDYRGLEWREELARLHRGETAGSFELDLRR